MFSRPAVVAIAFVIGCSRTEAPQPKAVAEPARDAAVAVVDAGVSPTKLEVPSLFTIIARAPTSLATQYLRPGDPLASPMIRVQRTAGGGLVVAATYARAHADGAGPLAVEILGRGLEAPIFYQPATTQSYQGLRWVWSDASLAVVVDETEQSRSGPRLVSYKLGPNGFQVLHPNVGYWSAAMRGDSVLALERTAYEVPNSSMYPKGSGYEQNEWRLKPARIAVLSGKGPAPSIPAGLCPTAMSAGADGTLVVAVDKCTGGAESAENGVLRYPPSSTQAKVEWFAPRKQKDASESDVVATFVASANEIYVAEGENLRTWNGKDWTPSVPFPGEAIGSLSRSPAGELWAVLRDNARVEKRSADGAMWTRVSLPSAPTDPLDAQAYAVPDFEDPSFRKVDDLQDSQAVRSQGGTDLIAYSVDATTDEVIVVATIEHEAFVLSTKARSPMARLPSIAVQRARFVQTCKRTPDASCPTTFLLFPETTTADAVRAAIGADAGANGPKIGEATVEGQKRLVVHGEKDALTAASKRLGSLPFKRICGPVVVERPL